MPEGWAPQTTYGDPSRQYSPYLGRRKGDCMFARLAPLQTTRKGSARGAKVSPVIRAVDHTVTPPARDKVSMLFHVPSKPPTLNDDSVFTALPSQPPRTR
jgi:hypothetical protein